MSSPGPWITPELQNGWESHPDFPLRWRIAADGGLSFVGYAQQPDEDYSKPLFQLNLIYRHFFGQELKRVAKDDKGLEYVNRTRIDNAGWVFVERLEA